MDERLAIEIERLRKLKTKALQARYQELFGEETRSSNQAHLFRRIAWRLQARAEGELSERARKRAGELADETALRLRAPQRFWRDDGSVGLGAPRGSRFPLAAGGRRSRTGVWRTARLKYVCWRRASSIRTRSTLR